jgi:hypothetical protein
MNFSRARLRNIRMFLIKYPQISLKHNSRTINFIKIWLDFIKASLNLVIVHLLDMINQKKMKVAQI